nr:PREDICTED: sodium-coupled neutral amino acid transporter 5-like [Struthio camelus australis]
MNGNYLVILVSITIILPLALMKQLGYLGYASGFSLSCMVFFLISVSAADMAPGCAGILGHKAPLPAAGPGIPHACTGAPLPGLPGLRLIRSMTTEHLCCLH